MVSSIAIIRVSFLYEIRNKLRASEAARRVRNTFGKGTGSDEITRFRFG